MSKQTSPSSPSERRSFLTRFKAGAASLAALTVGGVAMVQVKSAPATRFEPARHSQDDWMDEIPGKHRLCCDSTNADSLSDGLRNANNFLIANRNGYGLESKDVALIVVARHQSTSFAFNDEMWAKYGASFAGDLPPALAKEPHTANPNSATLASLAKEGVHFAVCAMATRRLARTIAGVTNGDADAIFSELMSHLIPNAHMAAAGIVAVNRAQERGYSFVRG
jgi:intracellular sulfur oxidation DsrE/DsrF family protein